MRSGLVLVFGVVVAGCRPSARQASDSDAVVEAASPSRATASVEERPAPAGSTSPTARRAWVEIYYPGWTMAARPPAAIDWTGATDVVLFGLLPEGKRVETASTGLSPDRIAAASAAARAAGASVLVCVGGERTGPRFREAFDLEGGRPLATSIAAFVLQHGLDGVVLDIEPLEAIPPSALVSFVAALREHLRGDAGALRLEAVVAPNLREIDRLAPIATHLDRVGVMSYLDAHSAERERELAEHLARIGLERSKIGVGIDARTSDVVATERMRLVETGLAGGVVFWQAGAVCDRADAGARCNPVPARFRR